MAQVLRAIVKGPCEICNGTGEEYKFDKQMSLTKQNHHLI